MAYIYNSPIHQTGTGNVLQLTGHSADEGKPLTQYSVEELRAERAWRRQLLNSERQRHWAMLAKLALWLFTGSGVTWLSAGALLWSHWVTIAAAAVGVALPGMAIYALSQRGDSEFATRQLQTLQEIGFLLREKGSS